jgi:hypothetical protein
MTDAPEPPNPQPDGRRPREIAVDPRDVQVMVSEEGRVAIRWGSHRQWTVINLTHTLANARPRSDNVEHLAPVLSTDELGDGWTERGPGASLPVLGDMALDLVHRCRLARRTNDGHPYGTWSTGEQLFVALVLRDRDTLDAMDHTVQEAAQRMLGEFWTPSDPATFLRWLEAIRVEVAFPGFVTGITPNTDGRS